MIFKKKRVYSRLVVDNAKAAKTKYRYLGGAMITTLLLEFNANAAVIDNIVYTTCTYIYTLWFVKLTSEPDCN